MQSYYVYILRCCDGCYYTGVTNDYELRVGQHQRGINPSCYTFKRRPVHLVYVTEFEDVNDAISYEKQLKRWSRKKKEALIMGDYDELPGLSMNPICRKIAEIKNLVHVMVSTVEP